MTRGLQKRNAQRLGSGLVVLAAGMFTAPADAAEEPTATLRCERASGPGRVRCGIEAHPASGRAITWGDVVLTSLPDFASALRGRLGDESLTARQGSVHAWDFALVAKGAGKGEVRARVRLVTCVTRAPSEADAGALDRCLPVTVEVRTELVVGS